MREAMIVLNKILYMMYGLGVGGTILVFLTLINLFVNIVRKK